jgi:hypothetical protein
MASRGTAIFAVDASSSANVRGAPDVDQHRPSASAGHAARGLDKASRSDVENLGKPTFATLASELRGAFKMMLVR